MKAILLAAGLGIRLRPITNTIPKCLVPIRGRPLLDIWIQNLLNSGVKDILINTHYLSHLVIEYIQKSEYKDSVQIVYEDVLLGTAGTLKENIKFFGGQDGLLIHADNYCEDELVEFYEAHRKRPSQCLMTMMTFRTDCPGSCGIVEIDKNKILVDFHEKKINPPGNLANGAIYALSSQLLNEIEASTEIGNDFSLDVIKVYKEKILTYETKRILLDIGTEHNYNKVR